MEELILSKPHGKFKYVFRYCIKLVTRLVNTTEKGLIFFDE